MKLSKINVLGWLGFFLGIYWGIASVYEIMHVMQSSLFDESTRYYGIISIFFMVVVIIPTYETDKIGVTKKFLRFNLCCLIAPFILGSGLEYFVFPLLSGLDNLGIALFVYYSVLVIYGMTVSHLSAKQMNYAYIISGNKYFKMAATLYKISESTMYIGVGVFIWLVAVVVYFVALIKYQPTEQPTEQFLN